MELLIVLACIAVVSGDVSHLKKYLPPTAQLEITQKYLPPVAQPEITQKYLPPIAQPQITQKFSAPAVPSLFSYPSTYSSAALHPPSSVSFTSSYTTPTIFSHGVSPAVSYSAPITSLSYTAPTYSLSHETTFHGIPALNPLPSYSNVYSGFDTAYNGQVNLGTEYYTKPEYVVHQPIVAQGPIEPVNSYEPIENNDSTVVSAAEYNENNGYSYKKPEGF